MDMAAVHRMNNSQADAQEAIQSELAADWSSIQAARALTQPRQQQQAAQRGDSSRGHTAKDSVGAAAALGQGTGQFRACDQQLGVSTGQADLPQYSQSYQKQPQLQQQGTGLTVAPALVSLPQMQPRTAHQLSASMNPVQYAKRQQQHQGGETQLAGPRQQHDQQLSAQDKQPVQDKQQPQQQGSLQKATSAPKELLCVRLRPRNTQTRQLLQSFGLKVLLEMPNNK